MFSVWFLIKMNSHFSVEYYSNNEFVRSLRELYIFEGYLQCRNPGLRKRKVYAILKRLHKDLMHHGFISQVVDLKIS